MTTKPNLELIAGDASDRKFYRSKTRDQESSICMEFPTWEGGFGGDPMSWIEMHEALSKMHIPIPKILKVDQPNCCIWIEDLGDYFLSSVPQEYFLSYYKESLSLLVKAQYPDAQVNSPASRKFFDFEKLYDEMKFFVKYFLNELMELNIQESNETHKGIFADLKLLCEKLDKYERVLCHRDYHSRNLMIKNDHIYWIDFQDARMGPHTYDVVSLVRDSYIKIDWNTRRILFDYYFSELNNARLKHNLTPILKSDYEMELSLMGLQRNLKAIGSFAYLASAKSKRNYLQYIKPTLEIVCAKEAKCINPMLDPQNDNFSNLFALLKTFLSRDYK